MSKALELVSVRLKEGNDLYSNTKVATSMDVAFLMGEEISNLSEDNICILNLNLKGNIININVCTVETIERNMSEVIGASILSNCGAVITISKGINERKDKAINMLQSNYDMLGIKFLDHVYQDKLEYSSYKNAGKIESELFVPKNIYASKNKVELENIDSDLKRIKLRVDEIFDSNSEVTKEKAIEIIKNELSYMDREVCTILSLDDKGSPINFSYVSIGDLKGSIASPREILKTPLLSNASSIIMLHNHPSGQEKPSLGDISVTNRVKYAARILGMKLEDHIVVGSFTKKTYSFLEDDSLENDLPLWLDNINENGLIGRTRKTNKKVR